MQEPLAAAGLAGSVWHAFRRAWGLLVVFEALFKFLGEGEPLRARLIPDTDSVT
jgi:hypothetical protein